MNELHTSKLDDAISRGFDPHQSYDLTPAEQARVDAARAEGRDLLADFAADVRAVRVAQIEQWRDEQEIARERDREWDS